MSAALDLAAAGEQLAEEGYCIVPGVLDAAALSRVEAALDRALEAMRAQGAATHTAILDPNAANQRVYNLPGWDRVFTDLLMSDEALALAALVLGGPALVSNFTANVALPGSLSMKVHADQALVIPPPWHQPWAMNAIWCLDAIDEENGATRYVPGSHRWTSFADVPEDLEALTVPFVAPAGALIAMEGRLWHTSGANRSRDRRRAMLFGYFTSDFIRQQVNWEASLDETVKAGFSPAERAAFGLGPAGNTHIGGALVRL